MSSMKILAGAAAALLLGLPATGRAQPMMHEGMHEGMHGGPEGMPALKILLRAAHLTPDQRTQVHGILRSTHDQARPLEDQMRRLHEQLASRLAGTASVTLQDLSPLQQQIDGLHGQMEQLHLKAALQIRALLTPDQLSRVAATQQKMMALHEQMRDLVGPPDGPEGGGPDGEAPPPPAP